MANNPDIYIEIGSMAVKKSDLKQKISTLPKVMTKATAEFFKKQKGFTTTKPSGSSVTGYKVSGNVITLKKQKKGQRELLMCTVSFALSILPGDKLIAGKQEGVGGTNLTNDLKDDAEFAVATATKEAAKTTVKQIEAANKKSK